MKRASERAKEGGRGERNSFLSAAAAAVGGSPLHLCSALSPPLGLGPPPSVRPSIMCVTRRLSEAGSTTPNAAASLRASRARGEASAVHRKPDNEPDSQTHTIAASESVGRLQPPLSEGAEHLGHLERDS